MRQNIKIVFSYLNLDLYLNLNFKVINLKCLNLKSKYWNVSYGFLKLYGLRSYFKFYNGFVKFKSLCPNLIIQSLTKLFCVCWIGKKTVHGSGSVWYMCLKV